MLNFLEKEFLSNVDSNVIIPLKMLKVKPHLFRILFRLNTLHNQSPKHLKFYTLRLYKFV